MSTSPDEPRVNSALRARSVQPPKRKARLSAVRRQSLSPLRGLIFIGSAIGILALLGWYADVVWELLSEFVPLGLEIAEEALDTFFELIGMAPGPAQIATAYLGFVLFLILFYIVLRKSMAWKRGLQQTYKDYRDLYADIVDDWSVSSKERFYAWWATLDWMQRTAYSIGFFLIIIPVFLVLSLALGTLVAMVI